MQLCSFKVINTLLESSLLNSDCKFCASNAAELTAVEYSTPQANSLPRSGLQTRALHCAKAQHSSKSSLAAEKLSFCRAVVVL